ncbi:ABC transporter permease [Acrocarpospora sp. B8E8]|uniref:ABC transporter permease n=1 Tax=Acrocarpospora sp. B8E8 TaxID=3153572 RepID=UPI00325EBD54
MSTTTGELAPPERAAPADRHEPGRNRAEARWLLWPPLAFFAVALGVPLAALVIRALDNETGGNSFTAALTMPVFLDSLARTLLMALVVTALTVLLGTVYATAVAVSPGWLKFLLVAALLLSLWTSIMVRTFGWMLLELPRGAIFWLGDMLGLMDEPLGVYQTAIAMYPAMVAVMLPFAVLPIASALAAIDREQLNAAAVFGSGPLLTFRAVIRPAITPAMISGGVLVFVMALGFYVTPLLLGGPTNMTVSGVISGQLRTAGRPDLGAAMSILLVGGTIAIYLVADRLFKVSEKWG